MMEWNDMEKEWQQVWEDRGSFKADPDDRPKRMITVAYPYPNSPQHIGHGRTYTIADIHARYWRMKGYNVLFPMGFHYTGTPILGMARRVQAGDDTILRGLRDIFGVSKDIIETFVDPLRIADYFRDEIKQGMMEMGYSIDWRREFTTIDEAYRRFVSWQIQTLRERGLIIQGSHPVGWCPEDANPVSQHDTLGDVEPDIIQYTLVMFDWDGVMLPAATVRPETVFGITNVWVNPDITYVKCEVDGVMWVITKECAAKLPHLGYDVRVVSEIRGADIIGIKVSTPLGGVVSVLEAGFVRSDTGTGIVMSVPAHAPYDYVALRELGLDIQPIQVIDTPGYDMCPAAQLCEDITIHDDARLEEATDTIYNKEFHDGVMREGCGRFGGMAVSECRDDISEWLCGMGSVPYMELSGVVQCRCGAVCVVKRLDNQWFLNYGDDTWKQKAHEHFGMMDIQPRELSGEFDRVIDWLRARACARQRGMGTRLPWDDNWIVESLADSTIYMAFYIVMKYVREGIISTDMMDGPFFDYVFLGVGDIPHARIVREEFLYYYPVDSRHSGRDLVPNHLTFFVMNHIAIFPKELWPRQIVVNGSVLMDGKKMSKSMGNIVPLRQAIVKYGADPIRLGMVMSAELLQDADISLDSVSGIRSRLERMILECSDTSEGVEPEFMEDWWFVHSVEARLHHIQYNVDRMRLREALGDILYGMDADYAWYKRRRAARGLGVPVGTSVWLARLRARLLSPFAPHTAEEMWRRTGGEGIVMEQSWPEATHGDGGRYIHAEHLLMAILEDVSKICRVSGITPHHITIYVCGVAEPYRVVLECVQSGHSSMKDVMGIISSTESWRHLRKDPRMIKRCLQDVLAEPAHIRKARLADVSFDELCVLQNELEHVIHTKYDVPVTVHDMCDVISGHADKAAAARPFKPAIYIDG